MPAALFVCPHCQKHAEVQVTSVTRSRPCPHCGEAVVLQVSAKDKGKRRALLVSTAEAPALITEPNKQTGPAYEPQPLEGDVLERMKLDPEVRQFRQRLIIGLSCLATVILIVVVWNFVGASVIDKMASISSEPVEKPKPVPLRADPNALPSNSIAMRRGAANVTPSGATKFVFEPPSKSAPDIETTSPVPSATQKPGVVLPEATPPKDAAPSIAEKGIEARENAGDSTKKVTLSMSDPRVQAAAAMERFLLANNIDAMLATVAERPKVEQLIRDYFSKQPLVPVAYDSLTISNGAGPTGERTIVITLKDGTTREAVVMREDGRSVVDWPSFVAWSDMEWAQFMEKKPAEPVLFRVIAESGERFDNAFADAKSLTCLKLSDPRSKSTTPLYAYVQRSSVIGEEIAFLMHQSEGKPTKLTLHLKYPTDAATKDQVWIESVLASGWILPRNKATAQVSAE